MSIFSETYLTNGYLKTEIVSADGVYRLVGENKWVAVYLCEPNRKMMVSKILIGLFDVAELTQLCPTKLSENERVSAALCIHTAGKSASIPEIWRSFAKNFYLGNA